ncbi:MAG: sodium-independent anion transporter [Actinobacteria bacterium HGW-Actinobacteria-7]|nr:MAG: sodium-independent anion transporter [Actinobacteria bacterium HGW-Actinobacteria-7]
MPAIVEAWRAGLLGKKNWLRNLGAGVVVGIVAIPLAMAFAIASGAKPEQGLYTAIIAGLVVTLFGGSRVQIAGPTGAFAVLLAGITAKYGFVGLQIATMMAGVFLFIFGLAKLGGVIRFIPESVILGFTAGIAVVIWVSQWPAFFGLPAAESEGFAQKLLSLARLLPQLDPATTVIGAVCVLVIVFWPRIPVLSTVPSPLVALVAATVLQSALHLPTVATIGTAFGGVPSGLPHVQLPMVSVSTVIDLIRPAFAIALLGAIESLLSATVADGMTGTRHNANQELVAQGVANVASGALGGFAATGALARTATSVRHGGNSPLAGIVHAAVVLLVLLALAPLAFNVPMAALAAILFVVAFNMSDIRHVVWTGLHAPRTDVAVMVVTLLLTVFTDLVLAVEVGVALAMVNFLRRMASSVEVRQVEGHELEACPDHDGSSGLPDGVLVYTIEGPFFFGAIEQFEAALMHTHTEPDTLVLNLSRVPFIDLTGLASLREVIETLARRDVDVVICGANQQVARRLEHDGIAAMMQAPVTSALCDVLQGTGKVAG